MAALAIRVGVVAVWDYRLTADAVYYYETAVNVSSGKGFLLPDGRLLGAVPPVFPFLLAMVFKVFGPSLLAAQLTQVVIGSITAPALFAVTRTYFDERAAFLAAAAFVVHPFYLWTGAAVLTEGLATLCLVVMAGLYVRAVQGRRLWVSGAVGLAAGVTALVKSALFAVGLWYVAALPFVAAGRTRVRFNKFVVAAMAFALPMALWAARNWHGLGRPAPLTLNGYQLFYEGNHAAAGYPSVTTLLHSPAYEDAVYGPAATPNADLAAEEFFRVWAADLWRAAWPKVVAAWPGKAVSFLRPAPVLPGAYDAVASAVGGGVLLLGWAGMLFYRRNTLAAAALAAPFFIMVVVHVVLKPFFRFRLPVEFVLLTYGAAFLAWLTRRRAPAGGPPPWKPYKEEQDVTPLS